MDPRQAILFLALVAIVLIHGSAVNGCDSSACSWASASECSACCGNYVECGNSEWNNGCVCKQSFPNMVLSNERMKKALINASRPARR